MDDHEEISVEVVLEELPLVLPRPLGGLRIVLLRASNTDDDSWELDFATVGIDSRDFWVEARDADGKKYGATTRWCSSEGGLVNGTYTFRPRLADIATSLQFVLSVDAEEGSATSGQEDAASAQVASHWVERLEAQLAAWARRDALIEAILATQTRSEAIERLTAAPFRFSDTWAASILDLPIGRLTREGEKDLREDLESVRRHLADG